MSHDLNSMENKTEQTLQAVGSDGLLCPAQNHPKIWQATMRLRWRKPDADPIMALMDAVNGRESLILQQAWTELATGEVEWRDVPKA